MSYSRLALILIYVAAMLALSSITFGVLWWRARNRARRAMLELSALRSSDADQLDRIETAIDGVAVEVERLAEVDRFAAQLLRKQLQDAIPAIRPATPSNSGRVNTPH